VIDGYRLYPGNVVQGPAMIERMGDCVVIPPRFVGEVDSYHTIAIGPIAGEAKQRSAMMRTSNESKG